MPIPRKHLLSTAGPNGLGFYHCISRVSSPEGRAVAGRDFVFGPHEREVFRKTLRQVEAFTGLRVVTWTILSNHFHVLVEVTPQEELDDVAILARCRSLYSEDAMVKVQLEYDEVSGRGGVPLRDWRRKYLKRMWDLSEFMKTLKQKFTKWFNRKHQREGTLWERRFKSVLVEGSCSCLLKVAAYIDLNAVRAGLVDDPKDYRWCGYAEAVSGCREARRGIIAALLRDQADAGWRHAAAAYRKLVFGIGEEQRGGAGISREEVARVWQAGGELSLAQVLRCRIRYFSDGVALGTESFVEEFFRARREIFGRDRASGARRLTGGAWGELRTLRGLKVGALGPPGGG